MRGATCSRSELYLFEMLTGRVAFEGTTVTSVRDAVLEGEVPAVSSLQPETPAAVEAVVRRCLVKDPNERFQTAGEVVRELKQASESILYARAHSTPAGDSQGKGQWSGWKARAVLVALAGLVAWGVVAGFQRGRRARLPDSVDRGPAASEPLRGPDTRYFADGMTEQLIADLATIDGLRVISRTSVMPYKDAPKPVPVIARELQVDAVIEGSVARNGGKIQITTTLIRGVNGRDHLVAAVRTRRGTMW